MPRLYTSRQAGRSGIWSLRRLERDTALIGNCVSDGHHPTAFRDHGSGPLALCCRSWKVLFVLGYWGEAPKLPFYRPRTVSIALPNSEGA